MTENFVRNTPKINQNYTTIHAYEEATNTHSSAMIGSSTNLFCNIVTAFENQSGKVNTAIYSTGRFLAFHSPHSQPTQAPRDT